MLGLHCCAWTFSSCSLWASHCGGFSCFRARVLGCTGSGVVAHRLVAPRHVDQGANDLPGQGIEPTPPALPGRFLTTGPPRRPFHINFIISFRKLKNDLEPLLELHCICRSICKQFLSFDIKLLL